MHSLRDRDIGQLRVHRLGVNMKKLLFFLLFPVMLNAAGTSSSGVSISGGVAAPAGYDETACVGYPDDNTSCSHTEQGTQQLNNLDVTRLRKWTATCDGRLSRVAIDIDQESALATGTIKGVVYNGTTLVATATITFAQNQWVWSADLAAEAGQSLDFSTNDDLYYGFSFDYDSSSFYTAREAEAEGANKNYYSVTGYLGATIEIPAVGSYQGLYALEYDY